MTTLSFQGILFKKDACGPLIRSVHSKGPGQVRALCDSLLPVTRKHRKQVMIMNQDKITFCDQLVLCHIRGPLFLLCLLRSLLQKLERKCSVVWNSKNCQSLTLNYLVQVSPVPHSCYVPSLKSLELSKLQLLSASNIGNYTLPSPLGRAIVRMT